jgi:hypothetical protein
VDASLSGRVKLFTRSTCGQALFFENTRCQTCGSQLAYFPEQNVVRPFDENGRYR